MRSWDVVAGYENLSIAKLAIEDLLIIGYPRKAIGLSVNSTTEDTDVSLTITNGELGKAILIFQQYQPKDLNVREVDTEELKGIQVVYLNDNKEDTDTKSKDQG